MITGPQDSPVVLKVQSDPMKLYALQQLGYPHVAVEVNESQLENAIRVTGDFIAQYFPQEQRLAVFYTQPLKPTYPLPKDAYWVQEVQWDPVTTRIDDVFGAEAYLFCLAPSFKILDKDGALQPLGDWRTHWKAKTPFGDRRLKIVGRDNRKALPKVRIHYGSGFVEATINHVLKSCDRWVEFGEVGVGDCLHGCKFNPVVDKIDHFESADATSVRAINAGCYYGCTDGEPVLIH